jgi:hypothetical protein
LSCRRFGADPVYPDRVGDVLDLLLAQIVEAQRQLVADLAVRRGRNANRAGLGKRLQPGRDVDPVAEQIDAIDDDVADMHANAQLHRLVEGTARVLRGDRGLDRDRALDGIDHAGEVGDDTVARGVKDAAPVRQDQLIDDDATCLQPGERADLVARHQPAITGNVGGEDRGEFPLYRMDRHAWLLPIRV